MAPENSVESREQIKKTLKNMKIDYSTGHTSKGDVLFNVKCKDSDKLQKLRDVKWRNDISIKEN